MSEESLEAWEREYEAWEEKYYDDWLNIGNPWEEDGPCSICRGDQVVEVHSGTDEMRFDPCPRCG
jgi:hypothetical protein